MAIGRLVGDGRFVPGTGARSSRLNVPLVGTISKAKISLLSAFETYAIVLAMHSPVPSARANPRRNVRRRLHSHQAEGRSDDCDAPESLAPLPAAQWYAYPALSWVP
jgi:hypothetical protein